LKHDWEPVLHRLSLNGDNSLILELCLLFLLSFLFESGHPIFECQGGSWSWAEFIIIKGITGQDVFYYHSQNFLLFELHLLIFPLEPIKEVILLMKIKGHGFTCKFFYLLVHRLILVDL